MAPSRTENEWYKEKSHDREAKEIEREKSREREVQDIDRERSRDREVKERIMEKSRDREVKVRIMYDKDSGRSRGFGFVNFSTKDEATLAKDAMHGFIRTAIEGLLCVGEKP
ncbi:glycine-rich RNA-binding protein 4, mitochondrial-like protein [Tanacetum coccineum]